MIAMAVRDVVSPDADGFGVEANNQDFVGSSSVGSDVVVWYGRPPQVICRHGTGSSSSTPSLSGLSQLNSN